MAAELRWAGGVGPGHRDAGRQARRSVRNDPVVGSSGTVLDAAIAFLRSEL